MERKSVIENNYYFTLDIIEISFYFKNNEGALLLIVGVKK